MYDAILLCISGICFYLLTKVVVERERNSSFEMEQFYGWDLIKS